MVTVSTFSIDLIVRYYLLAVLRCALRDCHLSRYVVEQAELLLSLDSDTSRDFHHAL